MKDLIDKIPENYQGKPVNLKEKVAEDNLEDALKSYERAKKRLLNPPVWHKLAGSLSAKFKIENPVEPNCDRLLKAGDYMSVNIHSPEAIIAQNYDWVQVKEIIEEKLSDLEAYFLLRLEVAPNPKNKKTNVDHFFKKGASSTFVIYRKENKVEAHYYGRNETPNNQNKNSTLENVRNEMVALGAMAGLSDLQWTALLKGLLQTEL